MATAKQAKTARRDVSKAQEAASSRRTIARTPKRTRSGPGQQGAAVGQRHRCGGNSPEARAEPEVIARQRDLAGRSKTVLDELARTFGYK